MCACTNLSVLSGSMLATVRILNLPMMWEGIIVMAPAPGTAFSIRCRLRDGNLQLQDGRYDYQSQLDTTRHEEVLQHTAK